MRYVLQCLAGICDLIIPPCKRNVLPKVCIVRVLKRNRTLISSFKSWKSFPICKPELSVAARSCSVKFGLQATAWIYRYEFDKEIIWRYESSLSSNVFSTASCQVASNPTSQVDGKAASPQYRQCILSFIRPDYPDSSRFGVATSFRASGFSMLRRIAGFDWKPGANSDHSRRRSLYSLHAANTRRPAGMMKLLVFRDCWCCSWRKICRVCSVCSCNFQANVIYCTFLYFQYNKKRQQVFRGCQGVVIRGSSNLSQRYKLFNSMVYPDHAVEYFCVTCDARCFPTGLVNPGTLRGDSRSAGRDFVRTSHLCRSAPRLAG